TWFSARRIGAPRQSCRNVFSSRNRLLSLWKGLRDMQTTVIQRQYDEIIASRYDFDPHSVIGDSLDRAVAQIQGNLAAGGNEDLHVLDLGVGTGRFLEKLRGAAGLNIRPFGLDISRAMIDVARARIPDLVAAIDDAANLDEYFRGQAFDLACTHFITGF